jgi:hypothetical protein
MIRSVTVDMRSLWVDAAPQRAQMPAMRVTLLAIGMSASNGANTSPKWSMSQPATTTLVPREMSFWIGATASDAKK